MDLMELASSLDTEQQRYVREGFSSDEELSVLSLIHIFISPSLDREKA